MSREWHINTDPDFMQYKLKLLDLSLRCHIYRQFSWKSHPLQLQVWPIKNRSWWQTKRLPLTFPITYCDGAIWQINEKHTKIRTDVNNGSWVTLSLCVMIFTVGSLYIYIYQTLLSRVTYKCDPGSQSLKSLGCISSKSQQYIVWVKMIDFSFLKKIIRILSKDHVPWRYLVNCLLQIYQNLIFNQ